jgi:hypothetical protein
MINTISVEGYRIAIRELCIHYDDTEISFLEYLKVCYNLSKEELANYETEESTRSAIRNGIFVCATGMLTYGQIEVVPDVLNNIPESGNARRLANVVSLLFPLPDELHPLTHPTAVVTWVENHKHKLHWNAIKEIFTLSE